MYTMYCYTAGMQTTEQATYTVTFDRVGRHHDVPPLTVTGGESVLDVALSKVARQHLASRDVEILYSLEELKGFFLCGVQNGGNFTIEVGNA